MIEVQEPKGYFHTEELRDFLDALEHTAECAKDVRRDIRQVKWLIISCRNAVQGACVCALDAASPSGLAPLSGTSAREMWHYLDVTSREDRHAPRPDPYLDNMLNLYRKVSGNRYLQVPVRRSQQLTRDMKWLNQSRNKFIHFVPCGWSIELAGLPRIVLNACDVIEHLTLEHPVGWKFEWEDNPRMIKMALTEVREEIGAWHEELGIQP